jgi:hypothetical protein
MKFFSRRTSVDDNLTLLQFLNLKLTRWQFPRDLYQLVNDTI